MKDLFVGCGIIAVVLTAVLGFVRGAVGYECSKYEDITGRPTKMAGLTCYVQDTGVWYSWPEYKYRLVTKGEMK